MMLKPAPAETAPFCSGNGDDLVALARGSYERVTRVHGHRVLGRVAPAVYEVLPAVPGHVEAVGAGGAVNDRLLAMFLEKERLHIVWPKRMTTREETQVDRMNDELFGLYKNFRYGDGLSRNKAIEKAAEHCGYGRSRGYEIVGIREGKAN